MDAVKRAGKMFLMPMNKLPESALDYAQFLSEKYGMCGEVLLTAFAHYAQSVEGLQCAIDSGYKIDDVGKAWFADRKHKQKQGG